MSEEIDFLKRTITTIPDFPQPGILFRDITSLCENPLAFSLMCKLMAAPYKDAKITKVAATEARGFVFGGAVAQILGAGFVFVRKPKKLPRAVYSQDYSLEYGTNTLEIHQDAIKAEDVVLLVDDLIATGGTIEATIDLVTKNKATLAGCTFAISLPDLGGQQHIVDKYGIPCHAVLDFPGH